MKKNLILAAMLILSSSFALQAFADDMNMRENCAAEAADAGIEDKDELENYIAECMDMMHQTQEEAAPVDEGDAENMDESGSQSGNE